MDLHHWHGYKCLFLSEREKLVCGLIKKMSKRIGQSTDCILLSSHVRVSK